MPLKEELADFLSLNKVTHQSQSPTWLSRRSRHRVWLKDVQLYVFCSAYRQENMRQNKSGAFEIYFDREEGMWTLGRRFYDFLCYSPRAKGSANASVPFKQEQKGSKRFSPSDWLLLNRPITNTACVLPYEQITTRRNDVFYDLVEIAPIWGAINLPTRARHGTIPTMKGGGRVGDNGGVSL